MNNKKNKNVEVIGNKVKTNKYILDIVRQLSLKIQDSQFKISKRGVPYFVLTINNERYSVCWFNKKKFWRIFWGVGSDDRQLVEDFESEEQVINHFNNLKKEKPFKENE